MKEGLWFRKLFLAVSGKHGAMQLLCDNESALSLMQSSATKISSRTQHIGVQFWFVLNHIMKGDVVPKFVRSEEMLADGFTKPYAGPAVESNMRRIGMCIPSEC